MISEVKIWDDRKGFGFLLNSDRHAPDIFIHHANIMGKGRKSLREGQLVEFDVEATAKGLCAMNCVPLR